jgi:CheY-like chemotaxis protein
MSTPNQRKRVLFVDDDQSFLEMIENLFSMWAKGSWEILLAPTTGKALALLQEKPMDLIVIDLHMPVMDGFQFLKLVHRKYPNLPKAIMTGAVDTAYRELCLANGAEIYLQKPAAIDQMESVFTMLNEIVDVQAVEGFRGVLRRVGLQEVLQLECLGTKSSVLEITTQGTKGSIYIRDGNIIHAHIGQKKGEDAFNRLLAFDTGEFVLKPFTDPGEESIHCQWEMLIMEAARLRDEVKMAADAEMAALAAAGGPKQPTAPAETPVAPVAKMPYTPPTIRPQRQPNPALPQPKIEEVIVCSNQGEALYEFQATDADIRVELARLLQKRGEEIAKKLNWGRCDRVEAPGNNTRMLFHMQKNCTVYVRSSNVTPQILAASATK